MNERVSYNISNAGIHTLAQNVFKGFDYENISIKNENVEFKDIDFIYHGTIPIQQTPQSFTFKNCRFLKKDDIFNSIFIAKNRSSKVRFEKCLGLGISANSSHLSNTRIEIVNSDFGNIELSQCHVSEFIHTKFSTLTINNSVLVNPLIGNLNQLNISIADSNVEGDLTIEKNTELSLKLFNVEVIRALKIKSNTISDKIHIEKSTTKKLSFSYNEGSIIILDSIPRILVVYRNKGDINLQTCKVESGKVSYNRNGSKFFVKTLDITSSFLFEKNSFQLISCESQELEHIRFSENNGELTLGNPRGKILPDLRKNRFSKVKLYLISNSENEYNLNLANVGVVEVSGLSVARFNIAAHKIDQLFISDATIDGEYHLTIQEVDKLIIKALDIEKLVISKSQITQLDISYSDLNTTEILSNSIDLANLSNNRTLGSIWLNEAEIDKTTIRESNVKELHLINPIIRELSFSQSSQSFVKIENVKSISTIQVSHKNKNDRDSGWFFKNDSIDKLSIQYCEVKGELLIDEQSKTEGHKSSFILSNSEFKSATFHHLKSIVTSNQCKYSDIIIKSYAKIKSNGSINFSSQFDVINNLYCKYYNGKKISFENLTLNGRLNIEDGHIAIVKISNSEFDRDNEPKFALNEIIINNTTVNTLIVEASKIANLKLKSCHPSSFLLKNLQLKNFV